MSSTTILFIIAAYFGLLLLIAWITGRGGASAADNDAFFLGNRRSPWYIVAIGMIGSSLSGVTFVSVPGWVRQIDMTYMQTVFGFFFGYVIIAHVLLPLYYRLQLTSIYTYLETRIGRLTRRAPPSSSSPRSSVRPRDSISWCLSSRRTSSRRGRSPLA